MFAQRLNELRVTVLIAPVSPLLVKDGRHREQDSKQALSFHPGVGRDPAHPRRRDGRGYGDYANAEDCFDMAFTWTKTAAGPRFYLPGSSLRGLLRATAEQIVGRWHPRWAQASDPFPNLAGQWVVETRRAGGDPSGAAIYAMAGPLDRCFGHTALRGRWQVADAWMHDERQAGVVVRDGVGISRQSGAAASEIKFQFEAITGGVFATTITLVNYEIWQLGLLAYVLQQIDGGAVRLGYGKHRGLGRVQLAVSELRWSWYAGYTPSQDAFVVPTLAMLAEQVQLPNHKHYDWRDAGLAAIQLPSSLAAPADAVLGSAWAMHPACMDPSNGFAATDWDAPPWAQFAAQLAPTLQGWELPKEIEQRFVAKESD